MIKTSDVGDVSPTYHWTSVLSSQVELWAREHLRLSIPTDMHLACSLQYVNGAAGS